MIEQQILQLCSWMLKRDSFDWLIDVYTFKLQPENNIRLKLIHLKSCWQCWLNTSIYTMNNSNLHTLTQHMFKSSFYRSWLTTKWFIFIYWYMTHTLFLHYIKTQFLGDCEIEIMGSEVLPGSPKHGRYYSPNWWLTFHLEG